MLDVYSVKQPSIFSNPSIFSFFLVLGVFLSWVRRIMASQMKIIKKKSSTWNVSLDPRLYVWSKWKPEWKFFEGNWIILWSNQIKAWLVILVIWMFWTLAFIDESHVIFFRLRPRECLQQTSKRKWLLAFLRCKHTPLDSKLAIFLFILIFWPCLDFGCIIES